MRLLKKLGLILLVLLVFLFIAGYIFIQSLKPDYEGEKQLPELSAEVNVYFDSYGIPHIYADNEADALKALGYVHAQDRLWQMELLRRVAPGKLSEVFGRDLVDTDRFFLALGISDATDQTVSQLDKSSPEAVLSQAYLDGVNAFIAEGPTPIEFHMRGLKKTPFTLNDIYNAIGYMGFSFAQAHKTDPLLTTIKNRLGPEYLVDLGIDIDPSTVLLKNYKKETQVSEALTAHVHKVLDGLPIPQFEGSNSWVLAKTKTKNGGVILANDPHIGFAQPSVWYEAHVVAANYEKYGYHLAGVPFPLLAHDRKLAYGLTMFQNDDADFYFEEPHPSDPSKYKTPSGYKAYEEVTKIIAVKDSSEVNFNFKKTLHGPVLNGIAKEIEGEQPVSLSWIYTQVENKLLQALYQLSHAKDITSFQEALPNIHAPGLNVMYGDREGNVAWWATAKLYQMPDSTHTKLILNGASGQDERQGFIDFSDNPQAINPPWEYVYSANNQPDSILGRFYPGYYLPENRAKRIVQLLEERDDWDVSSVSDMINDVTAPVDVEVVSELVKELDYKRLTDQQIRILDELNAWAGEHYLNSTQPPIFHRWIYQILRNTFEDELGEAQFSGFLKTHLQKRVIALMAANTSSVWWDDINTSVKTETKKDIVTTSYIEAVESLSQDFGEDPSQWTWDKVHTLEHGHPFGQLDFLKPIFNVGPFSVMGSREVINNMAFTYGPEGTFKVGSGPSTRRIIDFSDVENSISILPTGASGNPFSPHYDDQAEMFIKGEFRKMLMNKEEIQSSFKSILTFRSE